LIQQGFAWRKRLAVFSMLLLPLVLLSGRVQSPRVAAPVPAPAFGEPSRPLLAPAALTDSRQAPMPHSRPSRKLETTARPDPLPADDVAKLWQLVRKHRSDAEVKLAGIYLEGTLVPRNCQQAQILLQDASRKGNARATDMLVDPVTQCNQSQ
jgi:hypothetical protein